MRGFFVRIVSETVSGPAGHFHFPEETGILPVCPRGAAAGTSCMPTHHTTGEKMQTQQIRALIEDAKLVEQRTGILRQAIVKLARLNGLQVTEPDVQNSIAFITEYIEHAPALMELIEEAAANDGNQRDVQPILDATEDYFLDPEDIIPDHLGLVGLMDDAYMTHSLMQAISDRYKAQSDKTLLPLEAHEVNAFVRRLIGEPFVSILDDHVRATLAGPTLQQNIDRLLMALGRLNLSAGPDPIWGNARAAEIGGARLGVMSVFYGTR